MSAYVGVKHRPVVTAMLKTIFAQEELSKAQAQWDVVQTSFAKQWPKLAAAMEASRHEVLAYMSFPKAQIEKVVTELVPG